MNLYGFEDIINSCTIKVASFVVGDILHNFFFDLVFTNLLPSIDEVESTPLLLDAQV